MHVNETGCNQNKAKERKQGDIFSARDITSMPRKNTLNRARLSKQWGRTLEHDISWKYNDMAAIIIGVFT